MKAVLLAPLPPPIGGISGWTERMRKAKLKDGWTIAVVDEKLIGREVFGPTSKKNIFVEIKRCRIIWRNLKNALKDSDVKIVHSCIPSFMTSMIREYVCAKIAKRRGKKFIVHFRCTVPNTTKGKLGWFLLKKLCNKSDMIFVLNDQSEKCLERITKTPIKTIPNFIDKNELFTNRIVNKELKTVVYVGGIIEEKGVKDLLDIAKKMPDLNFRFVGPGDDYFVKYAFLNNIDNVVFAGAKDKEGVKKELKNADVFAFLSYFRGEGFSNALCEAMATGLPCIVTDWAANADMIGKEGGTVIKVGDVDAAVNALKKMKPYEIREKQSKANIKKVESSYVDGVVLDKIVDSYEKLLGEKYE